MLQRVVLRVTIVFHVVKCLGLVYECCEVSPRELPQRLIDDFLIYLTTLYNLHSLYGVE
jgi:hypothetical protein